MDCSFAFLCDYAERDRKLHALGIGWDTLYAKSIPTIHPQMCFVARLRGSLAEAGEKSISVRILDADGGDVMTPMEQMVRLNVTPPVLEGAINLVLNFSGLEFKKYGRHAVYLVVQGTQLATVPFNVSEPPTTA